MDSKIRTIDLNEYDKGEESPFGIAPINTGCQKEDILYLNCNEWELVEETKTTPLIFINKLNNDKFTVYYDGIPIINKINGLDIPKDAINELEKYHPNIRVWVNWSIGIDEEKEEEDCCIEPVYDDFVIHEKSKFKDEIYYKVDLWQ